MVKTYVHVSKYIAYMRDTRGTETSKYPQEEKTTCDSVSSGERKRKSPNRFVAIRDGVWTDVLEDSARRMQMESCSYRR